MIGLYDQKSYAFSDNFFLEIRDNAFRDASETNPIGFRPKQSDRFGICDLNSRDYRKNGNFDDRLSITPTYFPRYCCQCAISRLSVTCLEKKQTIESQRVFKKKSQRSQGRRVESIASAITAAQTRHELYTRAEFRFRFFRPGRVQGIPRSRSERLRVSVNVQKTLSEFLPLRRSDTHTKTPTIV